MALEKLVENGQITIEKARTHRETADKSIKLIFSGLQQHS
jgi:hypothetical protein